MKKSLKVLCAAILTALVVSCATTGSDGGDPNVNKGIEAWNKRSPDAATAYWTDIEDPATQKKYLNYVTMYNAGKNALDSTDGVKNSGKLISASNTAISKFNGLDVALQIPAGSQFPGIANTSTSQSYNLSMNSLTKSKGPKSVISPATRTKSMSFSFRYL